MTIKLKDCIYTGEEKFKLADHPTSARVDKAEKDNYKALTAKNTAKIAELQDKLYAEAKEGVVILIQAMDAAGKDSTIKHVMSGINPQGCLVHSFKQPCHEELAHSYLWRAFMHMPERGYLGIFNRSYYEDVLVARVHELQKTYAMPKRCTDMSTDEFFEKRYRQISGFEQYLYENGYRVVKIFLNEGKDEQAKRFLARIDDESKNWKFSEADMKERALWDEYQKAYELAIGGTATKHAPWYVIPADQKWYARYLVSEAILKVLEDIDPQYPEMPEDQKANLAACKEKLLSEQN
jgi:PPK2 family polyphosphate:nucleotide phosphotransferase